MFGVVDGRVVEETCGAVVAGESIARTLDHQPVQPPNCEKQKEQQLYKKHPFRPHGTIRKNKNGFGGSGVPNVSHEERLGLEITGQQFIRPLVAAQ